MQSQFCPKPHRLAVHREDRPIARTVVILKSDLNEPVGIHASSRSKCMIVRSSVGWVLPQELTGTTGINKAHVLRLRLGDSGVE